MVFRFHTFLFADLVGFTSFTVRHGDERAADLAVCFQERVCALAATHGCHVVKTIGDAVMVRSDNGDAAIELGQASWHSRPRWLFRASASASTPVLPRSAMVTGSGRP